MSGATPLDVAAEVLRRRAGLALDVPGRARLGDALAEETARLGRSAGAVAATLDHDPRLLQSVVDAVTLQETSFFRDPAVFATIAEEVLPAIDGPVTVWSAGCADGQEAWSVAMLLAESGRPEWTVLATDISEPALRRARSATYAQGRLKGLSPERRDRHLEARDGAFAVRDELRSRVRFARHNLATDPVPRLAAGAQLVLCRNVLIYVDRPAISAFLARLHAALPPGALLLVGSAESVWHLSDHFELVPLGPGFAYRRGRQGTVPSVPNPRKPTGSGATERRNGREGTDPPVPSTDLPEAEELLVVGERALADGRSGEAIGAFRQAAYVAPDSVLAHLQLGLALEHAGDEGAVRAFRAARAALQRAEPGSVEQALGGYRVEDLARMLAAKLGPA